MIRRGHLGGIFSKAERTHPMVLSLLPIPLHVLAATLCFSAPVSGGAWTFPKNTLWVKTVLMAQDTNDEYIGIPRPNSVGGEKAPYLNDGNYSSRAVFVDAFYGLTDWLNVGLHLPYFSQTFDDTVLRSLLNGEKQTTSGVSDMRGFIKFRLLQGPIVTSMKIGIKAATGKFENRIGIIPVGEGQWDFDFVGQFGRSFWPIKGYVNVDFGYRLRTKNNKIDRDPGDEIFWIGEIGYQVHRKIMVAMKYEGTRGKSAKSLGLSFPDQAKRITYFTPVVMVGPFLDTISFEGQVRFSVNGRSFPAGAVFLFGFSYRMDFSKEK